MQIQIIQVAPTKDSNIKILESMFETRLQPFCKLETISVSASKSDDRNRAQTEEKDAIITKLKPDWHIIALDELGKQLSSPDFSELIKNKRDFGPGKIQFIIGGSNGLHPEILNSSAQSLSLSKMTFTHEMVRVFLKEQLYRAFAIIAGKRYHK